MTNRINAGDFHFDPRRRQQGPLSSTATDPDARAQFEEALRRAADKIAAGTGDGPEPVGDRPFPPRLG